MTRARPSRADAVRNRTRILTAAREQITEHGSDVGMDQIAAAAGVAVGTLYRHFPSKTELVAAVISEFVDQVVDDAEAAGRRVADGADALDEITGVLRRAVEAAANNHAAKAAADALGSHVGHRAAEERTAEAVGRMIKAGQAAGDIHPDVTVNDILLVLNSAPTYLPSAALNRWLTLILPGLATHARPVG